MINLLKWIKQIQIYIWKSLIYIQDLLIVLGFGYINNYA